MEVNSKVLLVDLPSADTIRYLTRSLSLSDNVVSKLRAQKVDGRFLKNEYLIGHLYKTLHAPPFSIPLGVCSKIESWVQASIRKSEEYEVKQIQTQYVLHCNKWVVSTTIK